MKYILMIIITVIISVALVFAKDKELVDTVNNLQEKIKTETNDYQKEIDEVYDAMKAMIPKEVELPSYSLFGEMQENVMKSLNLPVPDITTKPNGESCIDPETLGSYKVFIFISSSMPEKTLKNYMTDAFKLKDALLVMRGVIGDATYIKPTQDFITNISCGKKLSQLKPSDICDVSRVDINPLLFTLFNVEQVPAVVYSRVSYEALMIKANSAERLNDNDYFILFGDAPLAHVLEQFENAGAETGNYRKALQGVYGG